MTMTRELATVTDIFSKEEIKVDYDNDVFKEKYKSSLLERRDYIKKRTRARIMPTPDKAYRVLGAAGIQQRLRSSSYLNHIYSTDKEKLGLDKKGDEGLKQALSEFYKKNKISDEPQPPEKKLESTSENTSGVEEMTKDTHIDISKTEFEALLRASKAESESVASGMREEMAKWREEQNTQVASLNSSIAGLIAKIDSKYESMDSKFNSIDTSLTAKMNGMESSLNSKFESIDISLNAKFNSIEQSLNAKIDGVNQALNGKIDGINSAINGVNTSISGIGSKLTLFGIFIAVVLAIAGWFFSSIQSNQSAQPMVIYAQQPVQPQAAPQPPQVIVIPPSSTGDVNVTMPEKTDRHDGLHKNNIKPAQ